MAASAGEDPVDLGPWSAYVVGHHPYTLAGWHAESWDMMRASGSIADRGGPYGAPHELWELDDALGHLARRGPVDAAAFDGLRRSLARFVAASKEIYENAENPLYGSEEINWDGENAPCSVELISMMQNSSRLIADTVALRLWERCGAILGESLLTPTCPISAWRWEGQREQFQALVGAFQELIQTGDYPFLAEVADRLPELDPQAARRAGSHHLDPGEQQSRRLAELDAGLRQALLRQAPPEVWLDINCDRLVFFGTRYYLDRVPAGEKEQGYKKRLTEAEAGLLWVLAEHPGEQVSRTFIREEGGLSRTENDLDFEATSLRNKLRPAIVSYLAKWGGTLSEFAKKGFIEGIRGKHSLSGPYILRLDSARVRVSGPRPPWMLP